MVDSFENYLKLLENGDKFRNLLQHEKIEIVEKTPEELARKSRRQRIDYDPSMDETNKPTEESDDNEEVDVND